MQLLGGSDRVKLSFDTHDPDPAIAGNPRLKPVIILSQGAVRLNNVEVSLNGDTTNPGIGGGGGGHGYEGLGGAGFTGGGSAGDYEPVGNVGSEGNSSVSHGGSGLSGVIGGESTPDDQGGGGGTAHPFGTSGSAGDQNSVSPPGGYGGASAGGESPGQAIAFGGGGGGFATAGENGEGEGNNRGRVVGGRLLLPLAGGSGGGAGNSVGNILGAGNGGGGGGALSIVSFDSVVFVNTFVNATGARGTIGVSNTGGGGGGAGGALNVASAIGFRQSLTTIDLSGGPGGASLGNGGNGGVGGKGLLRVDANSGPCANCSVTGQQASALSLDRNFAEFTDEIEISGSAGAAPVMTDAIRIFYRNRHTDWQFVDTRAVFSNNRWSWRTRIPKLRNSSLFVIAYQQVNTPDRTEFNFEPDWISTHVSSAIFSVTARPRIVTVDSLHFGVVKTGACRELPITIANLGQAELQIGATTVNAPFSVVASPTNISGYDSSTATLKYCPTTSSCDTVTLEVVSNDQLRRIVLTGCGQDRDERIRIVPQPVRLGPTYVGECDSTIVTIYSIGADTADVIFTQIDKGSIRIDTATGSSRLAPGDSLKLKVFFCPGDSGLVTESFGMPDPNQNLSITGFGLRRILAINDTIRVLLCLGETEAYTDSLVNLGNDTIRISSIITSTWLSLIEPVLPSQLLPGEVLHVSFAVHAEGAGVSYHRIDYLSDSDSLGSTVLEFNVTVRDIEWMADNITTCASELDSTRLRIQNDGSADVIATIVAADARLLLTSPNSISIPPGIEGEFRFNYLPGASGTFNLPVSFRVSTMSCQDTTYAVVIQAVSTSEPLVIQPDTIDFGIVPTDSCVKRTLTVSHGCGEPVSFRVLQLPSATGFKLLDPAPATFTLESGQDLRITYEYCPTGTDAQSAVHEITTLTGDTFAVFLVGQPEEPPTPKFSVEFSDLVLLSGDVGTIRLSVIPDEGVSISEFGMTLTFDPRVAAFRAISDPVANRTSQANLVSPGRLEIHSAGPADPNTQEVELEFLGLLGPRSTTDVTAEDILIDGIAGASVDPGLIEVLDCTGLSGNISPAGSYVLGYPWPQPARDILKLWVKSGAKGPYRLQILNPAGSKLLDRTGDTDAGQQILDFPVQTLPSGAYFLVFESLGFRQTRPFWISR